MSLLVDTNVISELRKQRPDPSVSDWFGAVPSSTIRLSVLTVGELRRGAEMALRRDPVQGAALEAWLEEVLGGWADRLVPVDLEVSEAWGRLDAMRSLPIVDGLLGATALVHGWTLVTRNVADLAGTGIALYDPWTFGSDPQTDEEVGWSDSSTAPMIADEPW